MNAAKLRKMLVSLALAGVTVTSANALADPPQGGYGPGYGMGPGMMGGYGPQGGYGPGGGGPGAGGYGPGYGMGPGMMGGYGRGYGMLGQLNLSPEQWSKINTIHQDLAKQQWNLAGKMQQEAFKLRELMTADKRDRNAINDQYKRLQDIRQQRFQARLDAQEKVDSVLTTEQKDQLRQFRQRW